MSSTWEIANEKYPKRSWDQLSFDEQKVCTDEYYNKLFMTDANGIFVNKVVFFDQGGRQNPRFCKIVKKTAKFLFFQQVGNTFVDQEPNKTGYRASIHLNMFPTWDQNVGTPFRKKIDHYFTIYDNNKTYVDNWYD